MGQPAARLTDLHTCPMVTGIVPHVGGPITAPGAPTVITGKMPQARVTDVCTCVGPPDTILKGSAGVMAEKFPCARIGDSTAHGGVITVGFPTVLIGETGSGGGGGGAPAMVQSSSGSANAGDGGTAATATIGANQESTYEMVPALNTAAALSQPGPQAAALVTANKEGAPFCRRCWEAAQK